MKWWPTLWIAKDGWKLLQMRSPHQTQRVHGRKSTFSRLNPRSYQEHGSSATSACLMVWSQSWRPGIAFVVIFRKANLIPMHKLFHGAPFESSWCCLSSWNGICAPSTSAMPSSKPSLMPQSGFTYLMVLSQNTDTRRLAFVWRKVFMVSWLPPDSGANIFSTHWKRKALSQANMTHAFWSSQTCWESCMSMMQEFVQRMNVTSMSWFAGLQSMVLSWLVRDPFLNFLASSLFMTMRLAQSLQCSMDSSRKFLWQHQWKIATQTGFLPLPLHLESILMVNLWMRSGTTLRSSEGFSTCWQTLPLTFHLQWAKSQGSTTLPRKVMWLPSRWSSVTSSAWSTREHSSHQHSTAWLLGWCCIWKSLPHWSGSWAMCHQVVHWIHHHPGRLSSCMEVPTSIDHCPQHSRRGILCSKSSHAHPHSHLCHLDWDFIRFESSTLNNSIHPLSGVWGQQQSPCPCCQLTSTTWSSGISSGAMSRMETLKCSMLTLTCRMQITWPKVCLINLLRVITSPLKVGNGWP